MLSNYDLGVYVRSALLQVCDKEICQKEISNLFDGSENDVNYSLHKLIALGHITEKKEIV